MSTLWGIIVYLAAGLGVHILAYGNPVWSDAFTYVFVVLWIWFVIWWVIQWIFLAALIGVFIFLCYCVYHKLNYDRWPI